MRWCSYACRRAGLTETDRALERTVLELLEQRARGATICPSEAARVVGGEAWRPLMEAARAAAGGWSPRATWKSCRAAAADPSTAKGPIRIRRVR